VLAGRNGQYIAGKTVVSTTPPTGCQPQQLERKLRRLVPSRCRGTAILDRTIPSETPDAR
jgi:hypothetical protein